MFFRWIMSAPWMKPDLLPRRRRNHTVALLLFVVSTAPMAAAQPDALDLIQMVRDADRTLESTSDAALDASVLDSGAPVPFELVEAGWYSWYVHRAYSVVDNEAEWSLLWAHHNGESHGVPVEQWPTRPEVDFSKEMLLVVFMGASYCSGDWQRVVSVRTQTDADGGNLTTVWTDTQRAFVLDPVFYGDTNPYQFVKVPRIESRVVFASRHAAGDAVDAGASGATVGSIFNCKPSQSPFVYRAADPGTFAFLDVVPGPASTLPFLDTPLAEGV
jgi:hypothetical protein